MDEYSRLIEEVSLSMSTSLSPMRELMVKYEERHNIHPQGGIPVGILTVDGVHPCTASHENLQSVQVHVDS